jgi:hypothetical protein
MGYGSFCCHWLKSPVCCVLQLHTFIKVAEFLALVDLTYATAFADPKIRIDSAW